MARQRARTAQCGGEDGDPFPRRGHHVSSRAFGTTPAAAGQRNKKIVGKAGEEYFLLDAGEIFSFHAEGDIVWITTGRKRYHATQTLKVLEERLRNTSFQRIHRNALVNVDHVRKMSALSSQRWLITLNNAQEFIASKRQARGIRRLVNW